MLAAIEAHFAVALRPVLSTGAAVATGPSLGPPSDGKQLLEIVAHRLTLLGGEDGASPARSPASRIDVHRFTGDGTECNFVLPEGDHGAVAVESPPGSEARRGDDYFLEGNVIHFCVPPPKDVRIIVRIRGARVRGYEQTQLCRVDWSCRAWADSRAGADSLSRAAAAAVLTAALDLGALDGSDPAHPEVSLRLLRPVVALAGVARTALSIDGRTWQRTDLELALSADLEQIVALGAAEPQGIIREVRRRDG